MAQPQNILDFVVGWTWTSMPMTTSHSPTPLSLALAAEGRRDDVGDLGPDVAGLLVRTSHSQCNVLAPLRTQDLQPYRQPVRGSARHADARQSREVAAERQHVAQVHRQWILGLGAQGKRDCGRRSADDGVAFLERLVEI